MAIERNFPDEVRAGGSDGGETSRDPLSARAGWEASLDLEFAARGSRTYLAKRASVGPLVVQRPFYPEGDVAHVYLVHPPGGVVGGDRLELNVLAKQGTHVLLTTPAATKFYRSDGRIARQRQEIVADAASVEWLPQETIVFPDARAKIATRVMLSAQSRFVGWEIACYGRPASGLAFGAGRVSQDFELWVNDAPLVLDHLRLDGTADSMRAPFGLAGQPVLGTLLAYPATDALLNAARASVSHGVIAACTLVDGALVCRAVGAHADAVRDLFIAIWQQVRPGIMGRPAVAPRIWAT
jgi:urease accessory protein